MRAAVLPLLMFSAAFVSGQGKKGPEKKDEPRFVFVQPSAYGRDNACMLDAMRAVGAKCRGIVDVDENVADAELDRLNALGVRGVRINVPPVKAYEGGFAAKCLPRIERLNALEWTHDLVLYLAEPGLSPWTRLRASDSRKQPSARPATSRGSATCSTG